MVYGIKTIVEDKIKFINPLIVAQNKNKNSKTKGGI